jgi:geranylgeranyl pyrophosphate synthase
MTLSNATTISLTELFEHSQHQLQQIMVRAKADAWPIPLQQSIAHSLLAPSKLFRSLLVYTTGLALGARLEALDAAACAVECVHTYSLIHDDLPAMDDADTRRGRISNHKAHGDALAILAGDGLLSLAFELITSSPLSSEARVLQVQHLAQASGPGGMVGGQVLDMRNTAQSNVEVSLVHDLKTGALIRCCLQLAFVSANQAWCDTAEHFAIELGRLYQLQDDWLDHCGHEHRLGKPSGADAAHSKNTALAFRTPEEIQAQLHHSIKKVKQYAEQFTSNNDSLTELVEQICHRDY